MNGILLRGAVADGIDWPATGSNVGGYLATIRAATGLDFDIPTEAQWEWRMPLSNDQLQILLAVHTAHLLGSLHEKGLT